MHFTSHLAETAEADRAARELLGEDHPMVRELQRTLVACWQSVTVAVVLLGGVVAWLDGAHQAVAVVGAAVGVEVVLWVRIACLRFFVRECARDLIIEGRADLPLDAVRRERARLLDRAHCDDLADWLDRTWTVAERALRSPHLPPPFVDVRVAVAARPELTEISARLREDGPGVRGVALVERLLSEGGSPLYGGSVAALRQELRRIRFMLGA